MSILQEIYLYKLNFVNKQKSITSQKEIQSKIDDSKFNASFYEKLINENDKISIIGELKKASPSLGKFVKSEVDLVEIANIYEQNKISCLSILTDEKYFNGNIKDLIKIRNNTKLPILRKDFIVDEYQIYESKLVGSDCILLILAMIDQKKVNRFTAIAKEIGLDVIIEAHNDKELERAISMDSEIIGINNRNLNNFVTDLQTTINLSKKIKNKNSLIISESGYSSKTEITKIHELTGITNFLVGEFLMKSKNLASEISKLLN